MTLEGFEIENWSCIKRLRISGLPASGVVVICGPNRRGKSSIVQALRACLMDYPSSSKSGEVTSRFPRGTGEKPAVSVTFRCGETTYRIQKHFGTGKSELASKTQAGSWKVETTSAAESHDRTCELVGGSDSTKGLQQLLWLTQAEFRLPDPKRFDPSVQAQLRGILGVLQTPLDDRFIEQVKKRWNTWHSGQRKTGKPAALKDACNLAENLGALAKAKQELAECESKFVEIETLLRQAADLEQSIQELNRQLDRQNDELQKCRQEHKECQSRLLSRQQAENDFATAELERTAALDEQRWRAEAARRREADDAAVPTAEAAAAAAVQRIESLQHRQEEQRSRLSGLREERHAVQSQLSETTAKLAAIAEIERFSAVQSILLRAEELADQIAEIERYLAGLPAPEPKQLAAIKENRQQAERLRAQCDAVAMQLTLEPEAGAPAAQLAIDGGQQEVMTGGATVKKHVRRRADLTIAGWGRLVISRGGDQRTMDETEDQLQRLHEEFRNTAAEFGFSGSDSKAFDQLLERIADHREKKPMLESHKKELKRLVPGGLESLRADVRALQAKIAGAATLRQPDSERAPTVPVELEQRKTALETLIIDVDRQIINLETGGVALEAELRTARQQELAAKEALAASHARTKASREELGRMRTESQILDRLQRAESALAAARSRLQETQLTSRELTIDERLKSAEGDVRATELQLRDHSEKLHLIKGRLLDSEGLHARRASWAARVEGLTRVTDRESLERAAIDRLYELFEECRDKQLGALMGPIHDRVLSWMRLLDLGDYKHLQFNDAFLPQKLTNRSETAMFELSEESTGAQEQIGMLVRLALGSLLSSATEPAVAVLDDPLTHSDSGRMSRMRRILRRISEGDASLNPPAGPLQILIFTCHPEFFRDEQATVIDLEDAQIMSRLAV